MAKYHINGRGEPGRCTAEEGNCPFGDSESDHYDSREAAEEAYAKNFDTFKVSRERDKKEYLSSLVRTHSVTDLYDPKAMESLARTLKTGDSKTTPWEDLDKMVEDTDTYLSYDGLQREFDLTLNRVWPENTPMAVSMLVSLPQDSDDEKLSRTAEVMEELHRSGNQVVNGTYRFAIQDHDGGAVAKIIHRNGDEWQLSDSYKGEVYHSTSDLKELLKFQRDNHWASES